MTYKKVILHRLESDVKDVGEEIAELEEKQEWLNRTVEKTRQLSEVVIKEERCKEINMDLKKLRKKLRRTKVDLKHNKKMVAFIAADRDCSEESKNWRQKVTKNEECMDSFIT